MHWWMAVAFVPCAADYCNIPMYTTRNLVDSQGNAVGDVLVTIIGNEVIITIVATPGSTLSAAQVFVGTQSVPLDGSGAANTAAFPFNVQGLNSSTVTYTTTVWFPFICFFVACFPCILCMAL